MIVDDDPAVRAALRGVLERAGVRAVFEASGAAEAERVCAAEAPGVAVVSVSLPDGDGAELARRLREGSPQRVELVASATYEDAHRVAEMVEVGAAAYVVKHRPEEVLGAVRSVIAGSGLLSAEASRPVLEEVARLYERERSRNEELEQIVTKLQALSVTDWLTGLKNHGYFFDRLSEELARARRYDRPLAVVVADLDDFKAVNDAHGHAAGDAVLRTVGKVLRTQLRAVDIACRVGGEEFGLIMPDTDAEGAVAVAERVREAVHRRQVPGVGTITISVGIASFPEHALDRDELVEAADKALYLAKRQGKNRVRVAGQYGTVDHQRRPAQEPSNPVVRTLLEALRMRTPHLAERAVRVAETAMTLAPHLDLKVVEMEHLRLAALLHDVGMLGVPDGILFKSGVLTDEEWASMQGHSEEAYHLIVDAVHPDVAEAVLAHHERWDGSGYPRALEGEDIPFLGRVLAVVDAYVAMTSHRPYRRPLAPKTALEELRRHAGAQFDPAVVEAMIRAAVEVGWVATEPTGQVIEFPASGGASA